MGKWKVLYRKRPAWLTGEDERNRDERIGLSAVAPLAPDEAHYPGDWAGFVVSAIPAGREFSPADLADPNRAVVELELTDEEARDLRSGRTRIVAGRPQPVTFEHRFGAIAASLRAAFQDPEDLEAHEDERIREAVDENMRREQVHMDALAVWQESLKPVVDGGEIIEAQPLPRPAPLVLLDIPEPIFGLKAASLSRALPRTTVHTGAGLYEVGPGKTYSTIQSALDQLWSDQGSATFTATQEIRIYDGTYTECITLNGALAPMSRYHLKIASAAGNSPVLDCTGETNAIFAAAAIEFVDFEGLTILGTCTANYLVDMHYDSRQIVFRDCTIRGDSLNHVGIAYCLGYAYFIGCELSGEDGLNSWFECWGLAGAFIQCDLHDFTTAVVKSIRAAMLVEDCTIHDCGYFCMPSANSYYGQLRVVRNTVYNMTSGFLRFYGGNESSLLEISNNIFHTVPVFLHEYDDYAKFEQVRCIIDSNCYYNITKWLESVHDTDVTTFAAWQALGWDEHGIDTDPKLTDPASDDFSLQSTSPCWDTGHGSGVTTDYLGTALDPAHPPIGAWSPGALVKTPPTFTVGSVTDTLTVTLAGSSHRYRVRLETDAGVEEAESSRAGAGDVVFNTVAVGFHKITAWAVTADDVAALSEPSVAERVWSPGTLVVTPPGISASVSGQTVTVTLTGSAYRYRVRLETEAGVQETEVSRLGAGDIVFGSVAYGSHIVTAWSVDENDLALGEHSTTTADVLVIPDATQSFEAIANKIRGRFKTEVADDIPWGEILSKTTVSASATDNSYNDATEDLSVFVEGQQVLVSGFTESANNGYFTVVSATANKLVVSGGTLVTEAAGDSVTIKSSLPTQYDNDGSFERPTQAPWCRFTVLQGDTAQVTAGGSKRFRQPGVAVAQVFVPLSEGDARALQIADAVKLAFRSVTAAGVIYRSPSVENLGRREGEWQVNVTCPFFADDVV